eukprot:scaffold18751_cov245-Isochrysis_galbana.AAC.5
MPGPQSRTVALHMGCRRHAATTVWLTSHCRCCRTCPNDTAPAPLSPPAPSFPSTPPNPHRLGSLTTPPNTPPCIRASADSLRPRLKQRPCRCSRCACSHWR